jgi:HEAT repeat protein
MISEAEARQLLIDSCAVTSEAEHRILGELKSDEFVSLLVHIAVDADDYEGDAPMQAAYFLTKVSPELTQPHETALLALLHTAQGYAGDVALVLGRMKSQQAKPFIVEAVANGWWPEHFFAEALACYGGA